MLALRYGVKAMEVIAEGRSGEMVSLRADEIVVVPFSDAVATRKLVDAKWVALMDVFTDARKGKTELPKPA